MGAGVAERVKRAADVCHRHLGALHVKRPHVALFKIVCYAHRYELSHSFHLLVRLRVILSEEPHSSSGSPDNERISHSPLRASLDPSPAGRPESELGAFKCAPSCTPTPR